jgi:hypothetical protein
MLRKITIKQIYNTGHQDVAVLARNIFFWEVLPVQNLQALYIHILLEYRKFFYM